MHLNNCLTEEPLTFAKKTFSTTFSFLTFSLKILPGLAAMQPFLLRCLSLQALRRGAGRRRKGLVFRKMLHFGKIPKKIGKNSARKNISKIQEISDKFCKILFKETAKFSAIFNENFEIRERSTRTVQRSALCRSRRELSNEYLLAKFGFDTAENEPSKVQIT